jgi:anthranilate synthase/aminodeoxychorismate synthase-like glutamine amidotransferase
MILLVDNYDSFVHNLGRYIEILGHDIKIIRNDETTLSRIKVMNPEAIILSPGPNAPAQAGICNDLVERFGGDIPILGVCLGHQCIAQSYGSAVNRSAVPMHGKASVVHHSGSGLFANVPSPFEAGRYHSLIVDLDLQGPLKQTAQSDDGILMALQHETFPVYGVQFHPESILTQHGGTILENFLGLAFKWNEKKKAA